MKNFLFLGTRVVSEAVEGCQLMASKLQCMFDRMGYVAGEENRVLWLAERG